MLAGQIARMARVVWRAAAPRRPGAASGLSEALPPHVLAMACLMSLAALPAVAQRAPEPARPSPAEPRAREPGRPNAAPPSAAPRAPDPARPHAAERAWVEACILAALAHPPRAAFGRCAWRIAATCQGEPGEGLLIARLPTLPDRPQPLRICVLVETAIWQQQLDRWQRELGLLAAGPAVDVLRRAQRASGLSRHRLRGGGGTIGPVRGRGEPPVLPAGADGAAGARAQAAARRDPARDRRGLGRGTLRARRHRAVPHGAWRRCRSRGPAPGRPPSINDGRAAWPTRRWRGGRPPRLWRDGCGRATEGGGTEAGVRLR